MAAIITKKIYNQLWLLTTEEMENVNKIIWVLVGNTRSVR